MSGSQEPPSPYLHIPETESWRRKVKSEKPHIYTHTWFYSNYKLLLYFIIFYISLIQDMVNRQLATPHIWNDTMLIKSLAPGEVHVCPAEKSSHFVMLVCEPVGCQQCCPHFWVVTYALGQDWHLAWTFKFWILHLQFDCFTIYFKIKRSCTYSPMIILSIGLVTHTMHTCFKSNREREGFNITAQEDWTSTHFSILLSFSHNLFQPGEWMGLLDRWDSGRKSSVFKLEATAELPFSNLAVCVVPLPSWVGKIIGTKQ